MTKLFTELKIGSMTLKNRTFMSPISMGYGNPSGVPDDNQQAYWLERAKGDVGCIITDATSVDPNTPYLGNTLCFKDEDSIVAYKAFTDKIHAYGCKIIPQITHPGPESISSFYGITPISSSGYKNSMRLPTRELTLKEIPKIVEMYATASFNAKRAGFDGIELHAAHGYMLLGSFLSPLKNKRTDKYGGSLINRAHLLIDVIDAIKSKCGKDFPIILRISGSEKIEGGNTIKDMVALCPILEQHGIDAFEISGGSQYELPNKIMPSHGEREAINLEEALQIKKVVNVPVILVGKINNPKLAKSLIDEDKVDGVVLGRSLLADPEFVKKIEGNREDEIMPCASCLIGCVGQQSKRLPGTCVINPFCGKELTMKITPATSNKKIMIVGGGIGGMAAARMAAIRGFDVTIYEKRMTLGGQISLACKVPHKEEIGKWIFFLTKELKRLNVKVVLNHEVTVDEVKSSDYDVVLVCTGVNAKRLGDGYTAHEILDKKVSIPEGKVLIIGGGMVAVECAEFLNAHKKGPLSMTMIELKKRINDGEGPANNINTMARLKEIDLTAYCETKVISIDKDVVTLERHGETKVLEGFTHFIYAIGSNPNNTLYEEIKDCGKEVYNFGDSNKVAQALEAVHDGVNIVLNL